MKQKYFLFLIFLALFFSYYDNAQTTLKTQNEVVIYSNSFESPQDTAGLQRYVESIQPQWVIRDGGTTERLNDVVMLDSSTAIVVGSEGSILKTTDSGETWRNTAPQIDCIPEMDCIISWKSVVFYDSLNGIVAGESAILITSDCGEDWQFFSSPSENNFICIGDIGLENIYVGDDSGYVYNSLDTGKTWISERLTNLPLVSIFSRSGPFTWGLPIYALSHNSLFLKTEYPSSDWNEMQLEYFYGLGSAAFNGKFSENRTAFIVGVLGDFVPQSAIIRLRQQDSHWFSVGPENEFGELFGLSIPSSNVIYTCGSNGKILKSTNGGNDWISMDTPTSQTLNSIYFFDNERGFAVGDSGTILYIPNALSNQLKIDVSADKQIYQYGDTVQINVTVTNTSEQSKVLEFSSSCQASYEIVDDYNWMDDHGCLAVLTSLTLESMESFTWSFKYPDQTTKAPLEEGKHKIVGEVLGYGKSDTLKIIVTKSDSSYFPLNLNNEWNYTSNLFPHTEKFTDTLRINNKLYYGLSTNGAEPNLFFRQSENKVFVLDITDSTEAKLYDFNAEIGQSWELPEKFYCNYGKEITLVSNSDTVETPAGTFYNCYHFTHSAFCADAGVADTWFAKETGKVRYKEIFIAGEGDFVLTDYIVTSLDNNSEKLKDFSFRLFQNYPNPFNPSTKIKFVIPQSSFVNLKVYDVLGKEVATLVNEGKPAGEYEVEFSAKGGSASGGNSASGIGNLASGIYFYKLQTENYSSTKKMIYLK